MTTKIEWATETLNPIVGCTKKSAGCRGCYALRFAVRLAHNYNLHDNVRKRYASTVHKVNGKWEWTGKVALFPERLEIPLHWKKPRRVFLISMSDFFHVDVPFSFQCEILQVIGKCPQHTFMILTKRTEQLEMWNYAAGWHPYPNLWLGVTVENQEQADKRIPVLLEIPAAVHFVSVEPMLGAVGLTRWLGCSTCGNYGMIGYDCDSSEDCPDCNGDFIDQQLEGSFLDWVICGAESGPGARPMDLDWARDLRDQCQAAGVPFFFKRDSTGNRELDGRLWEQWPEVGQ